MAVYSSADRGRGPRHRRGESRRTGQWKLAYADFLTALMAFFLLLWLTTGSSAAEREAIASYFTGRKVDVQTSVVPPEPTIPTNFEPETIDLIDRALARLNRLGLPNEHLQTSRLADGFRIELTDASAEPLFETGKADLNERGMLAVQSIVSIVRLLPLTFEIEGHTDAFPLPQHGNWQLSNARAHSAWQAFVDAGLEPQKFTAITGRGDSEPLLPDAPHAPANRRITLIVRPNPSNRLN